MSSTITFHGGAGTVTGANFLLDTGEKKILIDCGSLQQEHTCDEANLADFAYDPSSIDVLVVTHAHADHIGRIPKLVHDGFRGTIYSTSATRDLTILMLNDALKIMQEHAEKFHCQMMYEADDIKAALDLWRTEEYHSPFSIGDTTVEFFDAGHILGSALVKFSRNGRSIIFTGDLGNTPEPLLKDTEMPVGANYILMESVYGDRVHEARDERREQLRAAVEDTRGHGGVLLIPSFSLERTQVLLSELNSMVEEGSMDPIPVYLDSPLATRITEVFRAHAELFNPAAHDRIKSGDDLFSFSGLTVIRNTGESHAIHHEQNPKVIISGAGMSGGGRIRDHEKYYLGDPKTTVLFVGYQSPGSLGRRLQDGAHKVDIDGEHIKVQAHVAALTGYSGHADRDQLMHFVEGAGETLEKVFVVMGEPKSSLFLAQRLKEFLGVDATVPEASQTVTIDL